MKIMRNVLSVAALSAALFCYASQSDAATVAPSGHYGKPTHAAVKGNLKYTNDVVFENCTYNTVYFSAYGQGLYYQNQPLEGGAPGNGYAYYTIDNPPPSVLASISANPDGSGIIYPSTYVAPGACIQVGNCPDECGETNPSAVIKINP